jgi:hypothetical protein
MPDMIPPILAEGEGTTNLKELNPGTTCTNLFVSPKQITSELDLATYLQVLTHPYVPAQHAPRTPVASPRSRRP